MYNKCLICKNNFNHLVLNNLPMRQCVNCGLIWRENFDLDLGYYQKEAIDFNSDKIQSRILNSEQRVDTFKKFANLNNLLDVGTSEGIFLKVLVDQGYKNVMGLEPSVENVDFVKNNNLRVIRGDINDISGVVALNNINTVTMFHVIEHLPDPLKSLRLIFASLKKGDKLIIETPNIEAYSFKKLNYKTRFIYNEHFFYFNKRTLDEILIKAGFSILANGKRDFNQNNLGIKECLFRLGLINRKVNIKITDSKETESIISSDYISKNKSSFLIKKIILVLCLFTIGSGFMGVLISWPQNPGLILLIICPSAGIYYLILRN